MGPLDGIGDATGSASPLGKTGSPSLGGGTALLRSAMSMLQQNGGLPGVLDMFRKSGMGAHVDSWVGTGANMPLSPDQLQSVFGHAAIGSTASQLGVPHGNACSALADLLPELIHQLTPNGSVPDDHADELSKALSMLRG